MKTESSKRTRRPALAATIAQALRVGATLLIAKLDRHRRNAGFIFSLPDSGVDSVCCDMPDVNTLTTGFFTVIAQYLRATISKRTREALTSRQGRETITGHAYYPYFRSHG